MRVDGVTRVGDAQFGFRHSRVMPAARFAHPAIGDDAGATYVIGFHMFGYAGDIGSARRFDDTLANIVVADVGD